MGTGEYRLFADDPQKIKFRLVASWIPGEKRQGMFRYKLNAWLDKPIAVDSESAKAAELAEKLLKRVHGCAITLELHDRDDFVLRRHPVPFITGVDPESGHMDSLTANDTFPMDAQEYKELVESGSWTILWNCGEPHE
jgi:hypothetical protein